MDYIDRKAVIEMLENAQLIPNGEYFGYCTEDIDIGKIPSVHFSSISHAQWFPIKADVLLPNVKWTCRCSNCGCPQDFKHSPGNRPSKPGTEPGAGCLHGILSPNLSKLQNGDGGLPIFPKKTSLQTNG